MAETAINLTIGGILSGIGYIALSIDEYSLKNEKILELQREINMIAPFIQNMQTSAPQIGIYGRLQKLAVLLQQIKNWIIEIGQMSKFKHFIFAISYTKQISQFYIEIKEIKMELGFEMRVGNFQSQAKLNKQMDDLLESLKKTDDCEKIKLLFDTQRELNEAKLEANRECFQDAVKHLNGLICEQDLRFEELNKRIQNVENFQPATLEHQRILLENQKVQLEIIRAKNHALELELMSKEKLCQKITPEMIEYSKIQLEMQKIQMELKSKYFTAIPTCECTSETSDRSVDYPYVATFCSQGCLGKKCNMVLENKERILCAKNDRIM